MPRPEDDATAVAVRPDGSWDHDAFMAEYQRGVAARHQRLKHDAQAVFRAMDGWGAVRSTEEWQATVQQAAEYLDTGGFLIDRLGAAHFLDPKLMAALLILRRRLVDEHGATTAAELMLIDCAVLSYYHQIRITGWIGDLAPLMESEFFGYDQTLRAKMKRH